MVGTKPVREILLVKHPCGRPLDVSAVTPLVPSAFNPHPIYFDHITGSLICSIALLVDGAVRPSNLNAHCWHHICSSYHGASADICNALASLARCLCSACHLIALDKCPGVRPIGVGEVIRWIIGKAILSVIGVAIQQFTGSLQLCAGQLTGCEAAIHALRHIYDDTSKQAALLVDASNVFNNLNRQLELANISTSFFSNSHKHLSQ